MPYIPLWCVCVKWPLLLASFSNSNTAFSAKPTVNAYRVDRVTIGSLAVVTFGTVNTHAAFSSL